MYELTIILIAREMQGYIYILEYIGKAINNSCSKLNMFRSLKSYLENLLLHHFLSIDIKIQSLTCCNIDRPNLCFTIDEHAIDDISLSIILWS